MPPPTVCGIIYLAIAAFMLIPAFVPWAAVPLVSPQTFTPSISPTSMPTSSSPTLSPTQTPTSWPSRHPSKSPSASPTTLPSSQRPSFTPSQSPTKSPSRSPSKTVTRRPSASPTTRPTSGSPSKSPSLHTNGPSVRLISDSPTQSPVQRPTAVRTGRRLQQMTSGGGGDIRLVWLLWLWPSLAYFMMGIAYLLDDPRDVTMHRSWGAILLGKELDGSMRMYCVIPMLPVLLPLWLIWYVRHSTWLRNQRPYDEIVPGIFLGRFPRRALCSRWSMGEVFPEACTIVVDLAAEMPIPRAVYRHRRYLCIPTLDQCAPNVEALREVGATLASHDNRFLLHHDASNFRRLNSNEDADGEGVRIKGSIYIMCANGRGRSVAFVIVLVVMRGDCETVEQAVELLKKARPQTNPGPAQLLAAREAIAVWRDEQRNRVSSSPLPNASVQQTQSNPERRRSLSNTDVVEMLEAEYFITSSPTTSKADVEDGSRKRRFDEPKLRSLYRFLIPTNQTEFKLRISRSDVELIAKEALAFSDKETGGDLFSAGVDVTSPTISLSHVIGAGKRAQITKRAFVQDGDYLREVMSILSPMHLQHIGDWHSHHEKDKPSDGDVDTILNVMSKTGKKLHVLLIANSRPGENIVTISAYRFQLDADDPRDYQHGSIELADDTEFAGDRYKIIQALEDARGRTAPTGEAGAADTALESTESRNVIDLTMT